MREVLEASGARDSGLPQRTEEHWIQETARCGRFWRLQGSGDSGLPQRTEEHWILETCGAGGSGDSRGARFRGSSEGESLGPRGSQQRLASR